MMLLIGLVSGCGARSDVDSLEWTAMGTVARVSFKDVDDRGKRNCCAEVRDVYAAIEAKLSIWDPDSEISRYTSLDAVTPAMRPCYEAAFLLQRQTDGVFNAFWRGAGKGPDLGGIAKGFAVDIAAERLAASGVGGSMLVDLGGNLKVVSGEWRTGIRDPSEKGGIVKVITLTNGMACATSGEYERGKHIRDGRTGMPVTNGVLSVTVVHPSSAMIADGLSTALFAMGRETGEKFLERHYPEATAYWIVSP